MFAKFREGRYFSALLALGAALLFGLNAPLSKLLLRDIPSMYMVAFLYLGAGLGVFLMHLLMPRTRREAPLSRRELPWTVSMILLDVLAPFLLMLGLKMTTAANASLLFNFEMVTTSVLALIFFHEKISRRLWLALGIITVASMILSVRLTDDSAWAFSFGSLLVMGACLCWGLENNCTRMMSAKSSAEIVVVKGFGSGGTALLLAWLSGQPFPASAAMIAGSLLLGFVAYGLSIFLYVRAQRQLGAARTSAYYAAAPFMGVLLSMAILHELPSWNFLAAVLLMITGVWITMKS